MATVLVFGSHRDVTTWVVHHLEAAGYDVVSTLDADGALRCLDERHVDVLVLGGPTAWRARDVVLARKTARAPWAPVVFPTSPDDVLVQVNRHFSEPMA